MLTEGVNSFVGFISPRSNLSTKRKRNCNSYRISIRFQSMLLQSPSHCAGYSFQQLVDSGIIPPHIIICSIAVFNPCYTRGNCLLARVFCLPSLLAKVPSSKQKGTSTCLQGFRGINVDGTQHYCSLKEMISFFARLEKYWISFDMSANLAMTTNKTFSFSH